MIGGMDAAEDECKGGEGLLFGDDDGQSMGVDAPQAATGDAAAEELYNAWPEDIAEDDDSTQEVDGQEAPMKLPTHPSDPIAEERERHNKTHLPHRPWCPVCVQARAREDKHYRQVKEERELGLPKFMMDHSQLEDTIEKVPELEEHELDEDDNT